MSNSIQLNSDKLIDNGGEICVGVNGNGSDNKQQHKINYEAIMNTTTSVSSFDISKNQRKDKFGNFIKKRMKKHKVSIDTKIQIIEIENYKSYNKESSFIFFEAFSDLPASCSSCIII
jgi:hypothetical protein